MEESMKILDSPVADPYTIRVMTGCSHFNTIINLEVLKNYFRIKKEGPIVGL